MRESDWTVLIDKIKRGQCTPFLGAGLSAPQVPLGGEFSARLAKARKPAKSTQRRS